MPRMTGIIIATILASCAHQAAAQDFYGGVMLDYNTPHAGDTHTAIGVLGGASWGDGALSYGVEGDYSTPVDGTDTYDALRLRGVVRYDFGPVTGLAGVGATRYSLNGDDFDGYNFGLGAEMGVSDNVDLRFEMIRDMMDDEYSTNVTTTRLGLAFHF